VFDFPLDAAFASDKVISAAGGGKRSSNNRRTEQVPLVDARRAESCAFSACDPQ
jgi:hypothetical protein